MEASSIMITLGVLFLAALALDAFGRIIHVPRVTLLILLGALLGPPGLDLLPALFDGAGEDFAAVALTMVAFLLGSSLEREALAEHGREILALSVSVVAMSALLVGGFLWVAGAHPAVALTLAGISVATAPAATRDVVRQSGRSGRFVSNLLGIVAIDDAWGLLVFSLLLTAAGVLAGGADPTHAIRAGIWEAGGGIALGLALGLPAAYLTGRVKPGEPSLLEALGIVLVCAGLAVRLDVSYLLAGMTAGAVVVNLAQHHSYAFHEIERIEFPFIVVFFILAGSLFDVAAIVQIGWIGAIYVLARMGARILGGWIGAAASGLPRREGLLMGLSLTPQAGVAIGMALVAADRLPDHGPQIVAVTVASTIVFELVGPFFTQYALSRVQDA